MNDSASMSHWLKRHTNILGPIILVAVVIVVFQLINPSFLSYQGLISLSYSMSYFLIAACGLTFVIMTGSFDFSVPSLLKLSALICVLYIGDYGLYVIPIALLICMGFGLINGVLVAWLNIPSFMASLGVSVIVEGIALYLSQGFLRMMYNETFRSLSTTFIWGMPSVLYWGLGVWIVSTVLALLTPFGRRTYAVGANPEGASLSGIDVDRYRIYVFVISGFLAGLAGVLYMAQLGGGSVNIGADMAIPLFAAVVAGGTSLSGGVGGPHGTLLGVVVITWTEVGMSTLALGTNVQLITFGILAIALTAVTMDRSKMETVT